MPHERDFLRPCVEYPPLRIGIFLSVFPPLSLSLSLSLSVCVCAVRQYFAGIDHAQLLQRRWQLLRFNVTRSLRSALSRAIRLAGY